MKISLGVRPVGRGAPVRRPREGGKHRKRGRVRAEALHGRAVLARDAREDDVLVRLRRAPLLDRDVERVGEYENSSDANANLGTKIPPIIAVMVLIVITLFNSLKKAAVIFMTVPLIIVGVVAVPSRCARPGAQLFNASTAQLVL